MSREVNKHGTTAQMPALRRNTDCQQRRSEDQGHGHPTSPALQSLRPEVHAEAPEACGLGERPFLQNAS